MARCSTAVGPTSALERVDNKDDDAIGTVQECVLPMHAIQVHTRRSYIHADSSWACKPSEMPPACLSPSGGRTG